MPRPRTERRREDSVPSSGRTAGGPHFREGGHTFCGVRMRGIGLDQGDGAGTRVVQRRIKQFAHDRLPSARLNGDLAASSRAMAPTLSPSSLTENRRLISPMRSAQAASIGLPRMSISAAWRGAPVRPGSHQRHAAHSDVDTASAEARSRRRIGEIAGRHQFKAGCARHNAHLGDQRPPKRRTALSSTPPAPPALRIPRTLGARFTRS